MNKLIFVSLASASLALNAGTVETAEWSSSEKPPFLGSMSLTYDGDSVKTLYVSAPDGVDSIILSGDAISFADGASIVSDSDATLRFDNKVVTLGALTVGAASSISYKGAYLYADRDTLMFPGVSVTNFVIAGSIFDGTDSPGGGKQLLSGGGFPFFPARGKDATTGADTLSAQLQVWNSAYSRAVRVLLTDTEDGIVGRIPEALFCTNIGYCVIGEDMYTARDCTQTVDKVLTPETPAGSYHLGLNQLTLASRRDTITKVDLNGDYEIGGEISVCHDAEVTIRGTDESATIANDFSGLGKVTLAPPISDDECESESLASQLTQSWQIVATNRKLEDFVSGSGYLNGSSVAAGTGPASAMFFTLSANKQSASVQFQYKADPTATESGLVIVIFAKMRQNGNNVEIKGECSGNFTASASKQFGTFKPVTAGTDYAWRYLAESSSADHYGIYNMTFSFRKENVNKYKFPGYVTGNYQVVASNRKLSDFKSAYGYMNGTQCGSTRTGPTTVFFFTPNSSGSEAAIQFHWRRSDGCVYCVFANMRQNGDDVEIKGNASGYYNESETRQFGKFKPDTNKGGSTYDPELYDYRWLSLATSASEASIAIYDIMFEFEPRSFVRTVSGNVAKMGVASTIAAVGDSEAGKITFKTGSENAFPKYGKVEAGANATLDLVYKGSGLPEYLNSEGKSMIVVNGGTLRSYERWSYGITQHAIVRNAKVDFTVEESWDPTGTKAYKYVNFLSLFDGSRLVGKGLSLGGGYDAEFNVQGSGPASIQQYLLMSAINAARVWSINFNVYDTTGDDSPDLTLNGELQSEGVGKDYVTACKNGDGVLLQNAASQLSQPLQVNHGTWKFGASNVCTSGVTLGADTVLAAAASTVNNLGKLTVEGAAKLNFGSGSQLTFNSIEMNSDGSLVLEGDFTSTSLRIGTSRCLGLLRSRIRLSDGSRIVQDPQGYITPAAGFTIFVR